MLKKVFKIFLKTLLGVLVLLLVLWIFLQTSFFQNFLVQRITKKLSKDLHTTVSIQHVNFSLFNRMALEKTLILDQKKDTLLYAGSLRVNITDWFFFKDQVVLHYIGLDDAVIHLNRKTPEWNYQFLMDYFSGGTKSSGKSNPMKLDLKIIALKNINIFQQDQWIGTDLYAGVKNLRIEADKLDLVNQFLRINQITLNHPVFAQYDYDGLRPTGYKSPVNSKNTDTTGALAGWNITAKTISITNGQVAIVKETRRQPTPGLFDDQRVILSELNGVFHNTAFKSDTLKSKVDFSLIDRGGFRIKKFTANFKLAPGMMEFEDADIQTANSRLRDYFVMHYKSFNKDMNDFVHAVKIEGNFKDALVSSDDISYFAPELKSWKRNFILNGRITGKVENLTANNFSISSGKENFLSGDLSMRGLPDIDETFIGLRIKEMRTSYPQLAEFIPELRSITQPNIRSLGQIKYTGSFTGYYNDFVTFGNLATSIGSLKTDLHLKFKPNQIPVYSGTLSTGNFNLGKFLEESQIGNVAFDGKLNGSGFTENDIKIALDGIIQNIQFNNYTYTNIFAHGNVSKNLFSGSASIRDPNIMVDTLVGTINFSNKNPFFNFYADVLRLNLKPLGFSNGDVSMIGRFNFDFTGKTIDDFVGNARVTDARLWANGKQLSFDSLNISSSVFENSKLLTLRTNELEATINGNFKIVDLKEAFLLFLNKYYPAYVHKPSRKIDNQDFTFMIHTRNISDFINLFDKRLSGLDESVFQGNVNIQKNIFDLQSTIPQFKFSNIALNGINIQSKGGRDSLQLEMDIEDVVFNDSLHSPDTKLNLVASNDISEIHITTSSNKTLNSADLSANIQTMENGFDLKFHPSTFIINQKRWTIQGNSEFKLINDLITVNQLKLSQNGQEITVESHPSEFTNGNDISIGIKNLIMEDFTPLFFKYPKMQGLLSGNVLITDPFKKPTVAFNTSFDQFIFENDTVGTVKVSGNYLKNTGSLTASLVSEDEPYRIKGDIATNLADSTSPLSGNIKLDNSGIHVLGSFLVGIVDDVRGRATGNLTLSGTLNHPELTGKVSLDSTSMTVDYTQCRYTMKPNSIITFNPDEIDFGTITLYDINKKTATLSGKIFHNAFDNFFFNDLHIKTNDNFLLLNTTSRDNKEFYGTVKGQAELSLNGFVTDMRMSIKGEPTDSSTIFLPIGETVESEGLDYIEFVQFGHEMTANTRVVKNTNIRVDMEVTANPLAKINVILDETTGDIIEARGNGKLLISVGTTDPLTIRGRYNVEQGDYTFNFQTFVKTPFTLQQGFIEWQGDPYLATMNIDAVYRATNVDLSNIPTSTGMSNAKGDIDIIFKLRGTLKDPSPTFEFQFPFDNPLKSDPIASEYLKSRFQSDNNQLLNQVASLLLFNTFLTTNQGGMLAGNATGYFVTKTVGQLLSATLTSSLNSWLQKLIKTNTVNLYTNINTADLSFQKSINEQQIQNLGDFGLRTSLLHNKLLINAGGNLDRLNPSLSNNNSNFLFTPDVSFEYLISPNGNLRVIGFNRSDADQGNIVGITRRNRTGIQLSYRKDFDSFTEFFTGKKKKAKQALQQQKK